MGRRRLCLLAVLASAFALATPMCVRAEPGGGNWSGYQRKGINAGYGNGPWLNDWKRRPQPQYSSQVNAGSFQRPYPYHLDYYRMKYGGSYAPYFGNLYGPPNYYYYSQPYYGDYSPYYGYNGYGNGNGYPPGGYGGVYMGGSMGGYGGPMGAGPAGFSGAPGEGGYGMPMAPPVANDAAAEAAVAE
jgi:hypothetical protein